LCCEGLKTLFGCNGLFAAQGCSYRYCTGLEAVQSLYERAINLLNTHPNPRPNPLSISHVAFCRSLFRGNCAHHLQMRCVTG